MIRRPSEMKVETRENMRGGAGKVTIRHYFGKDEMRANIRLCSHLTLPPGAGIGLHPHEKEDEIFIVTRGSGLLSDGQGEVRVSKGDAMLTGNGARHAIRNDGTEDLEITAIIACYA